MQALVLTVLLSGAPEAIFGLPCRNDDQRAR